MTLYNAINVLYQTSPNKFVEMDLSDMEKFIYMINRFVSITNPILVNNLSGNCRTRNILVYYNIYLYGKYGGRKPNHIYTKPLPADKKKPKPKEVLSFQEKVIYCEMNDIDFNDFKFYLKIGFYTSDELKHINKKIKNYENR